MDIYVSEVVIGALLSLVLAQVTKFVIYSIRNSRNEIHMIISTGGMPSSHSAFVSGLTTSILLYGGAQSYSFAIALVFSIIIIHDSMGVRYEASKHATILNQIIDELPVEKQAKFNQGKDLKEKLGHKPRESLVGVIFGIVVATLLWILFSFI